MAKVSVFDGRYGVVLVILIGVARNSGCVGRNVVFLFLASALYLVFLALRCVIIVNLPVCACYSVCPGEGN